MVAHLLLLVISFIALPEVHAGTVNTTSQRVDEGSQVSITCYFSVEDNEVLNSIYIDTYIRNRGFVDVVKFWANGTAEYLPFAESLRNRTSLVVMEDSVALRFNDVRCFDSGEYYCNLRTNASYDYKWMALTVKGPSVRPSLLMTKHSGCYDDGDDVEAACAGVFETHSARFHWHGFRSDNSSIDLTHLADPGTPYWRPTSCGYKRISHIKFNISEADDGMILRCFISDEEAGVMPSVNDECGDSCAEVKAIQINRHPQKPTFANFQTSTCPGGKIQAACYGETGTPTGYYKWYKHKAGHDPVDITNSSDPGSPYRLHGSCQYERAGMITLTATRADNGVVLRCVLHDNESDILGTPTEDCGHHCAESKKITVRASCAKPPTKAKPTPTFAGATTLTATSFTIFLTAFLLLVVKQGLCA